eukprot:TRINITY_DN70103_c0_g1_i1.p1 TRINITY_DN70103_c0_g1~~TRINITY_DN70103_c0_g1_i1.p1  ORF type:complete len:174 (+),score=28.04 TRINITY_DN70103_c0_g1_i1:175-696(+)
MPQQKVATTRKSQTRLTDKYPWVEVLLRAVGACTKTVGFAIRIVLAEFLFGVLADRVFVYGPVKMVGALFAAAGLAWTVKQNAHNLMQCKFTVLEVTSLIHKCLNIGAPFVWFALRCLDWELGMPAAGGVLGLNLTILLACVALNPPVGAGGSQKAAKAADKEDKKKSGKKSS